ncbi:MAG: hypothetical protein NC121_00680 [Blautia sp.]|nr:hypothetical protein [Blautia sp.]
MGKISGKSLAEKYNDFLEPCVQVITPSGEIPSGDGIYLEKVEVVASTGLEPDMAIVAYQADKSAEQDFTRIEKYLDAGQKIEIKAGYGDKLSRIFQGYLHQTEAEDAMGQYVEYTLVCLDVKGLMKKNSVFQISGKKKAGQILNDILNTGCYGSFLEKKEIDPLPGELNQDCTIRGETHYDWLCSLAAGLDYEFFCGTGKAVFRKARKEGGDVLELAVDYGLQKVRRIVTMGEQTGCIQVCGYNRKDEKISGLADWPGASGAFTKKMRQALAGCALTFLDMELETGEEAEKRAEALMNRMAGKCVRMEAITTGLPELLPGICAEIAGDQTPSLTGRIYVQEVCHLLDENGYTTTAAGVEI